MAKTFRIAILTDKAHIIQGNLPDTRQPIQRAKIWALKIKVSHAHGRWFNCNCVHDNPQYTSVNSRKQLVLDLTAGGLFLKYPGYKQSNILTSAILAQFKFKFQILNSKSCKVIILTARSVGSSVLAELKLSRSLWEPSKYYCAKFSDIFLWAWNMAIVISKQVKTLHSCWCQVWDNLQYDSPRPYGTIVVTGKAFVISAHWRRVSV